MERGILAMTVGLGLLASACAGPGPTGPATKAADRWTRPLIVAHRGGAALAPENTLAAFENALRIGVDMVELDVHLSLDGAVVVMHDSDLSRTTDGKGRVGELPLDELLRLNAAATFRGPSFGSQAVPTLADVLRLVKDKAGAQIEIKTVDGKRYPGIEEKVLAKVAEYGMTDNVVIISFDFETIKTARALNPRVATGALASREYFLRRPLERPEKIMEDIFSLKADYFMPQYSYASDALVQAAHKTGIKVGVWTVNDETAMAKMRDLGVDAITSDRPDLLKEVLGR
ncbi:MAG: glycerophosphodiester phosphodiesterase family protein [Chloroflexota bacterium]